MSVRACAVLETSSSETADYCCMTTRHITSAEVKQFLASKSEGSTIPSTGHIWHKTSPTPLFPKVKMALKGECFSDIRANG